MQRRFALKSGLPPAQARVENEMEEAESQEKSDPSSEEETDMGLDSDVESVKLNRHLFGLEHSEGLLQVIYATEEISEPTKETSA